MVWDTGKIKTCERLSHAKLRLMQSLFWVMHRYKNNFDDAKELFELSENTQSTIEKAQARFTERQKKAADRSQATAEYAADAKAREAKTARLRELRLAREEPERAAESSTPATAKPKRAPRGVKGKTIFSRIVTKSAKG